MTAHAKAPLDVRLQSGNYRDTCEDCGQVTIGSTADDVLGSSCACKRVPVASEWHLDLICSLCNRVHKTLKLPSSTVRVYFTRTVRCAHCAGPVYAADQPELVRVYRQPTIRPPHRGRPRKTAQLELV